MKLWLISQGANTAYDTYDSAVVCAENEYEAVRIDPEEFRVWSDKENSWLWCNETPLAHSSWVSDLNDITCKMIGEALPDQQKGVILASFNAG